MGYRILGPTCQVKNSHSEPIDVGTLARTTHHAPGPHGRHPRHHRKLKSPSAPTTLSVVVFDQHQVAAFLHEVARVTVLVRRAMGSGTGQSRMT